jgi:hypothetical protein
LTRSRTGFLSITLVAAAATAAIAKRAAIKAAKDRVVLRRLPLVNMSALSVPGELLLKTKPPHRQMS